MTITKEAWQSIMERYKRHIYHSDRVTNHLRDLVGIQVVTNDPLALIRNTSIGIFPDKVTGALRRDTCKTFMFKIFKGVFEVLANCDDVHTYVFCLDRFGARRREKVNRPKVVKEGEPEYLTVPPGQQEFFLDDAEMPGTTDQIFSNHGPKLAFYAYLTRFVQTQAFRDHIPAGKCFILSGAISASNWLDQPVHLPPVQVFADRVVSLDHFRCDHISEGDLDVWRWAIYYNDCNCCVISYDGDVFLIGLMQIRNLVTEGSDRRILFLTRRSVGSAAVPELALKRKAELKVRRAIVYDTVLAETGGDVQEAYRASGGLVSSTAIYNTLVLASPSSSSQDSSLSQGRDLNSVNDDAIGQDPNSNQNDPDPDIDVVVPERDAKRRAPVWAMQYIDMVGIHDDIIRTEYDNRELRATFNRNPAVSAVLALFLSSEKVDFVETKRVSRMLGSEYFWAAFQEDPHKFRDLVMVSDSGLGDRIFSYAIDVHCLELLVLAAYTLKCKRTMKVTKAIEKEAVKLQKYRLVDYTNARDGGYGSGLAGLSPIITDLGAIEQELLFKAQTEKGMQNCAKYINEDDLNVTAAQCVWLLQYWGNGVFHHYTIPDGLALDVEGHPLYGYIEQGWAPKVTVSRYKIAPPLIGGDTQQ